MAQRTVRDEGGNIGLACKIFGVSQTTSRNCPRLWSYNHDRPNMAIGGINPKQKPALAA
jgi:putative transposase